MKAMIMIVLMLVSSVVKSDGELDKWVEKQIAKEQKAKYAKETQDRNFVKDPIKNFLLGSLKFKSNIGYTDTNGFSDGSGNATQINFRSNETVWGVKLGYFGKKIVRDIYLSGDLKRLDKYRKKKNDAVRWALIDAVKLNMSVGYGQSINNPKGAGNYTRDARTNFFVGLSYEVPLGKLGAEFIE